MQPSLSIRIQPVLLNATPRSWPARRQALEDQITSSIRQSHLATNCIPSHASVALAKSPKLKLQDVNSLYLAGKVTQFIYNSDVNQPFHLAQECLRICRLAAQWFQGMAYQIWYQPKNWHFASAFMMYARGITALKIVYLQDDSTEHFARLKTKLAELNLNPRNYTWEFFSSQYIVYFKFNLLGKHSYIGMSSTTFEHRELNRRRKWLQLQKGRFTSCEQALRFWHATQTYHHYVSIVVLNAHSKAAALAHEATRSKSNCYLETIPQFAFHQGFF